MNRINALHELLHRLLDSERRIKIEISQNERIVSLTNEILHQLRNKLIQNKECVRIIETEIAKAISEN